MWCTACSCSGFSTIPTFPMLATVYNKVVYNCLCSFHKVDQQRLLQVVCFLRLYFTNTILQISWKPRNKWGIPGHFFRAWQRGYQLITSHLLSKQEWHKQTLPWGGRASVCNYNWAHLLHVLRIVLPILCSDSRNRLTTVVAEQVQPTQWLPDQCLLFGTWKAIRWDFKIPVGERGEGGCTFATIVYCA